ncbi:MAG: Rne/Rng family ribonuclease [Elusimicrobiaceae bacterium]|nr:Rne/Rng family ribonuclease [Elusimicrobiaceae bacterium]
MKQVAVEEEKKTVEVLVNTSFEETRIAVLENERVNEILWERRGALNIVGNIYKGIVENVLPGISSAFLNIGYEKNAYLYISDVIGGDKKNIDKALKKGQEVMVQVVKDAISTKGMKVTMDVTLPGRYLVLTPNQNFVGLSKNIEDADLRHKLNDIIQSLADKHLNGMGCIVRTEAEEATKNELEREIKYLYRQWQSISKKFETVRGPHLLHEDMDAVLQVARDVLNENAKVYLLDNRKDYERVKDFVEKNSPDLADRVQLYKGKTPIFEAYNIEPEIDNLRKIKLPLPNGGSIIIQEAESLCAIDVNTGKFTGSKSQEETVTQTNIEAAGEIAHQLRLRNIGGIIVIDFIDMRKASSRHRVVEALARAVQGDRAKIRILPITKLGLVEMTRERKRASTGSFISEECPQCHGSGRVLSAESMRIKIQREIYDLTSGRPGGSLRVVLHPVLAEAIRRRQEDIEENIHRSLKIQADPQLAWEDYKIVLE